MNIIFDVKSNIPVPMLSDTMKNHVLTDYAYLSDADLSKLAFIVAHSVADNYYFPDPLPSIDTLIRKSMAFNLALKNASGSVQKDKIREELLQALELLAKYVNKVSGGKEAILLTSGFAFIKEEMQHVMPHFINVKDQPNVFVFKFTSLRAV